MSLKHLIIGTVLAICTFAAQAAAQKNELAGMLGATFISNQGIQGSPSFDVLRSGNGFTFEVNYARHFVQGPFWSLAAEVPFLVNPDEDLHTTSNPFISYRSYFVTPAARLNLFPEQAVSPWVSFGGGFSHFSVTSGSNSKSTGNTTGVLQAGLGLDVKIIGRFSLRGEARDFWSGVPNLNVNTGKSRQHNILVAGGIVWHF
jgi:hypothetical protein